MARLLSLLVLAAALLAVQGTFGGPSMLGERIDLPAGGDCGCECDDDADMTLPALDVAPASRPNTVGRSFFDAHRAPAMSPVASRIFRPPISLLA